MPDLSIPSCHLTWSMDLMDISRPLRDGFRWKEDNQVPQRDEEPTPEECPMCAGPVYEQVRCPDCVKEVGMKARTSALSFCSKSCLSSKDDTHCSHRILFVMKPPMTATYLNTRLHRTAKECLYFNINIDPPPDACVSKSTDFSPKYLLAYHVTANPKRSIFHTGLPELEHIQASWKVIRQELLTYIGHNDADAAAPWVQAGISTDPKLFKQMYLVLMGKRMPLANHFQKTVTLFEQMPVTLITISVMEPGNRVEWHAGFREYSENVIRCHLPLIVPEDGSPENLALNVMNEAMQWKEGEVFCFDDCDQHEAYNFTKGTRYILIFDLIRPQRIPYRPNIWESEAYRNLFDVKVPYQDMVRTLTDEVVKTNFEVLKRIGWSGLRCQDMEEKKVNRLEKKSMID